MLSDISFAENGCIVDYRENILCGYKQPLISFRVSTPEIIQMYDDI